LIQRGAREEQARVRSQRETHPGFFWLDLELPLDYPEVLPGQYLNLRVGTRIDPLFRRPFGVVEAKREGGATRVELYYAVVGPGTRAMSRWREGDHVDCLGPLGEPYRFDSSRPALLVAGGRGAAPLLFLHRLLEERGHPRIAFAFGARSRGLLFGLDRLPEPRLLLATEDGSAGSQGTIVDVLERERPTWLEQGGVVYACGPERFLGAVAAMAARHDLACQVSLEGIYGCGIGLCRGCAVPLVGEDRYLMQCVEGPVVDAARIDWERMPHV
jgi:dihydroorotate dehydrogenase electron transfer subunit